MAKRGRKAQERIIDMPLDLIVQPAYEMRTVMSEEKIVTLQKSIKLLGLLQPIVVKLRKDGKYEIIAGYRRFIAHERNKAASILVRVLDTDNVNNELAKMHENIEREDVSVMDEARFIGRLNKDMKMTQAEISRSLCRSEAYVSQKIAILDAPDIVQEALEDGVISFSVARELVKVTDETELHRLLEYAVRNGVTPAVARAWRMQWEAQACNESTYDAGNSIPLPNNNETPTQQFICDSCEKPTEVNRMKVMRVCPDCYRIVKES